MSSNGYPKRSTTPLSYITRKDPVGFPGFPVALEAASASSAGKARARQERTPTGGAQRPLAGTHLQTGLGAVRVKAPRVEDRREGHRFSSAILPRYLRKVASLENLVPSLYLMGVSSSNMQRALEAILGSGACGLSSTTVVRLKEVWQEEFSRWKDRDLSGKHYVYVWADGIYFNVRCEDARPCILVLVGALADGTKELIAIADGERESKRSWSEVLIDLKRRVLTAASKLAVDGALGFWAAMEEQWPQTRAQRCWVHKTANVASLRSSGPYRR
jgi:putative transposase